VALRLVVDSEDRNRRYPLAEGENLVGSSPDCGVRIPHPSISRRHAAIRVAGDDAEIEDLGSRNGTRVGDRPVDGPQPLATGQALTLGSVSARLERVAAKDLEPAVTFAIREPPRSGAEEGGADGEDAGEDAGGNGGVPAAASTAGVGSLQTFALEHLPELLGHLAGKSGVLRTAQAVGAALFSTLPCLSIEITSRGRDGVLFRARRSERGGGSEVDARVDNRVVSVLGGFAHPTHARAYAPLIEAAALLVELAADDGPAPPPTLPVGVPPPLPEPPTVVPEVRELYADAARVARGDVSVLIRGESGTGKEVLARYLHAASRRAAMPFVALNCAALPRDLLESELFGIERGVATGVESRPGKFEMAAGGTLFLDEIGDMALETQARILRVLQEGEVYRLGGQKPRSADVRVVAATNRDLEALIDSGAFRSDLYHRIADWPVRLPPLRDRRADVPNLAAYFLDEEGRRQGLPVAGISRGAMELLEGYHWPGNIRQLEREMARVVLFLEAGQLLESSHLQEAIRQAGTAAPRSLRERLEEVERREIVRTLARHQGNVSATADELQIGLSTLYRRLRELDVDPQR
jgi:hypothetical protein